MIQRFLRLPEVRQVTGLATSSIYQQIALGRFPKPVPLDVGGRRVGWVEAEVAEWQAACLAARERRGKPGGVR
jgi:prophage regulatory protein